MGKIIEDVVQEVGSRHISAKYDNISCVACQRRTEKEGMILDSMFRGPGGNFVISFLESDIRPDRILSIYELMIEQIESKYPELVL